MDSPKGYASAEDAYEMESDDIGDYVYEEYDSDMDGSSHAAADAAVETKTAERDREYVALGPEHLEREFDGVAAETAELLAVSADDAEVLLARSEWNKRRLQEQWFDSEERVRKRAGLSAGARPVSPAKAEFTCMACYDEAPPERGSHLRCRHDFCHECWSSFLRTKVLQDRNALAARCMMHTCPESITRATVATLAEPDVVRKYRAQQLRSFVQDNRDTRWCPGVDCLYAVRVPGGCASALDVACACGHQFCFRCGIEAHRPAPCEWVRQWDEKNSAESENVTWIRANTKPCPKCAAPIEKNQGCNHMTCRRLAGGCGHDFCWLCLDPWAQHGSATGGYYRCNKYETMKESGKVSEDDVAREAARTELQRYLHHFERFDNHAKSREFGKKTLAMIGDKMNMLQETHRLKLPEVMFLREAAEAVIECRRVLKWTYVFAFYQPEGREKNLFLFLQVRSHWQCCFCLCCCWRRVLTVPRAGELGEEHGAPARPGGEAAGHVLAGRVTRGFLRPPLRRYQLYIHYAQVPPQPAGRRGQRTDKRGGAVVRRRAYVRCRVLIQYRFWVCACVCAACRLPSHSVLNLALRKAAVRGRNANECARTSPIGQSAINHFCFEMLPSRGNARTSSVLGTQRRPAAGCASKHECHGSGC